MSTEISLSARYDAYVAQYVTGGPRKVHQRIRAGNDLGAWVPRVEDLKRTYTPHRMTWMHLAAAYGNANAVRFLSETAMRLGQQDWITQPDARGWSPLHHAALGSHVAVMKVLKEHGREISLDDCGGSPENITDRLAPYPRAQRCWVEDETGRPRPMSARQVADLTGCTEILLRDSRYTPAQLFDLWNQTLSPVIEDGLVTVDGREAGLWDQTYSVVSLRKDARMGFCAVARTKIAAGRVFGEYLGKRVNFDEQAERKRRIGMLNEACKGIAPNTYEYALRQQEVIRKCMQDSEYTLGSVIDALEYRGLCAFTADGFPNTVGISIEGLRGTAARVYCVYAGRTIQPGELITINYGISHDIKSGGHIEPYPEEVERFIAQLKAKYDNQTPLTQALKARMIATVTSLSSGRASLNLKDSAAVAGELKMERLRYLASTPTTLLPLVMRGVVKGEDAIAFLDGLDSSLSRIHPEFWACLVWLTGIISKLTAVPDPSTRSALFKKLTQGLELKGLQPTATEWMEILKVPMVRGRPSDWGRTPEG